MFRALMVAGLIVGAAYTLPANEPKAYWGIKKVTSVDLKKTHKKQVDDVEAFFGKFAQGNEGKAEVTEAKYDTTNGEIKIGVNVRCRHTAGGVHNPFSGKRATIVVYDYDIDGTFTLNYKTGKTTGKVKIGGKNVIEFELGDIADKLKDVVK